MNTMAKINLEDGDLTYHPNFLNSSESVFYFNYFLEHTNWQSGSIKIFGKTHKIPRLQAWHGDPEAHYSYSNMSLDPAPWSEPLLELKKKIEVISQSSYNSVLLNLYRDGSDSNGYHSDDEKELGKNPSIASLSLGESRNFHLKHKSKKLKHTITLNSGSLIIMAGSTQHFWKHQIPKSKKELKPRINLTFRRIFV